MARRRDNRTTRVQIRFSEAEETRLEELAHASRLTVSDYVRAMLDQGMVFAQVMIHRDKQTEVSSEIVSIE